MSIVFAVVVLMFAFGNNTKAGDIRYISVKSAPLKEEPKNFSKTLETLEELDEVEVLEKVGTWLLVITESSMEGYIQESVVSVEIVSSDVSDELATGDSSTAGARGFNSEVEAEYKDKEDFDFESVDRAEKLTEKFPKNPDVRFAEFRRAGKLGEYAE